jgi:hypothetical protein
MSAWRYWEGRPQFHGTLPPKFALTGRADLAAAPLQSAVSVPAWKRNEWILKPLAVFEVKAVVISKQPYRDELAHLSPLDLAVGWGPLVQTWRNYHWDHSFRYLGWEFQNPQEGAMLQNHAANIHIIPRDRNIYDRLNGKKAGDVVSLAGYLIEAIRPDGAYWRSSLSRDDSGKGACEILWVEAVE